MRSPMMLSLIIYLRGFAFQVIGKTGLKVKKTGYLVW